MKYLLADKEVIDFHSKTYKFASKVNQLCFEQNEKETKYPMASEALFSLSSDTVALHRAIKSLCESGWAFPCSILLRSMLDCMINVGIICNEPQKAEYMGFKYMHCYIKGTLSDSKSSKEHKDYAKRSLSQAIEKLPQNYKGKAQDFFGQKRSAYWFNPEFSKPSDVLEKLASPGTQELYRIYSGSTHGGFIGNRIFRDEPDNTHPNPRADKKAQNLALVASSRFLIEISTVRGNFEVGGISKFREAIIGEFQELNKFMLGVPNKQ